jgi:hypothetical protein
VVRTYVASTLALAVVLTAGVAASSAVRASSLPAGIPDPAADPVRVALSALRPPTKLAASDRPVVYRNGCHVLTRSVVRARVCTYGDKRATRTVVLIGDSHAAQWFPAFEKATVALHLRLLYLTKSACPGIAVSVRNHGYYRECDRWRESAYALIRKLPRVDLLVVGESAHAALLQRPSKVLITDPSARAREWSAGVRRTVTDLGGVSREIVLLRDTPELGADSARCLVARRGDNRACGAAYSKTSAAPIWHAESSVAQQHPAVGTADFTAAFCTPARCRPVTSTGILRWRDRGHMSATFAALLTPMVETMLRRAMKGQLTN